MHKHSPDTADAVMFFDQFLFDDVVKMAAELLAHVCAVHCAAIVFKEEMQKLLFFSPVRKVEAEECIRFMRDLLLFFSLDQLTFFFADFWDFQLVTDPCS